MSFGEVLWAMFLGFCFVAYLIVLAQIFADLFRNQNTSGWAKAAWIIALVVFPFLTALIYVIARGQQMGERSMHEMQKQRQAQEAYIRDVAATGPVDELERAQRMLRDGTITLAEYERLKAKALA